MTAVQKPKPSVAAAILIPVAIWIVTSVIGGVFIVMGVQAVSSAVDDLERAPVGGDGQVELEAGDQRVFLEGDGVNDIFGPDALIGITDPDGNAVDVELYGSGTSLTYDLGGHEGTATWTFDAPTDGTYTVNLQTSESAVEGVAIGKDNPVTAWVGMGVIGIAIGSIGFLIAIVVLIIMLVRRGRSKKRLAPAPGSYPPPGYQAGSWGPGSQ